jgi:hypothetical protein
VPHLFAEPAHSGPGTIRKHDSKQRKGALRNVDKPTFPAGSKTNSLLPPPCMLMASQRFCYYMTSCGTFSVSVGGLRM